MLTFYIGSYTEYILPGFGGSGQGIYTVQLNPTTGHLSKLHTEFSRNPSYLAISNDNKLLYCVTELFENGSPRVKAYNIKDDYSLEFLNEQPVSGGLPCHLAVHGTNVFVACYETGNVFQFPLEESGELKPEEKAYQHTGSSVNQERQETPHAHQIAIHPNAKEIYVCDLGIDWVKAYRLQDSAFVPNPNKDCEITKGGGPRHMVFNQEGTLAYVMNELTGDISVLHEKDGAFKELNSYASLPGNFKSVPSGSAIRLHPHGTFLYAANRELEAITLFAIVKDTLQLLAYQYTGGDEVREFNITPDGEWLIACHQNSHDTVVYKIQGDGKLEETYRTQEILSPVCVCFPKLR